MLSLRRHNIFKLKIGKRAVADDVAHVAAIKQALGDKASVRVDVNQAWDEASASRGLAMLEDAGVDLVEQPIAKANRSGLARLAARFIIPIMADEALHGPDDAFDLAQPRRCRRVRGQDRAVRWSCRLPAGWAPSRMPRASAFTAARCSRPASARSPRRTSSRPSRSLPGAPNSSVRCC